MEKTDIIFDIEKYSDEYVKHFIDCFLGKNINLVKKLALKAYGDNNELSFLAFNETIKGELYKACNTFVTSKSDLTKINNYLFACIYNIFKKAKSSGKKSVYICPGCKFFGRTETLVFASDKKVICVSCREHLKNDSQEKWKTTLHSVFTEHKTRGFKCLKCTRFIPDNDHDDISCPYPDCGFTGDKKSLVRMRHPTVKSSMEVLVPNVFINEEKDPDTTDILKIDIDNYIKIINDCIDQQVSVLRFNSNNSTYINKLCMYNAIKNIVANYPVDAAAYFVLLNRNVKIQHKIFQEFVGLLEKEIPFSFVKNGRNCEVKSLLDLDLCVFDGLSEFEATIDDNLEIPNLTSEMYIGSRKGSYNKPYYMGKVLDIVDLKTKKSLLPLVQTFGFTKIKMSPECPSRLKVRVSHYRIIPHYQCGGLYYLNKIRRHLVDKIYLVLNGEKREIGKNKSTVNVFK